MPNYPPELLPAGARAPAFRLNAVQSGKVIEPVDPGRRALVLLFHNQHTLAAVRDVQEAVRPKYPLGAEVVIASVADLSGVPRLLRPMVDPTLKRAYAEGARYVPKELDPADYVVILPDWKGDVSKAFGAGDVSKAAALVVIDSKGMVIGSHKGQKLGSTALEFLARA